MDAYAPEVERKMQRLYDSLKEGDRRRYAAIEAIFRTATLSSRRSRGSRRSI
jgi:hypothetical protein